MNTILPILFSVFSIGGSLCAGRRLSGAKGLVLSGLFLGFAAAFATQNENIIRFAWMIGAFGAIGMLACGDLDTFDSAKLVSSRKNRPTGLAGIAIKGFLLFGTGAGFVSFGIMSLGMVSHTLADTLLLFCLLAIAPLAGIQLFNRGENRLRLSKTKNESWGKNLFIFASLACIFLVKGDFFSLSVSVVAGLFGVMGQFAALLFHKRSSPSLCEFTAGAFGGLGTTLGIFIANKLFPATLSSGWFVSSGKLSGYIPQGFSLAFAALWCLLWALPLFLPRFKKELINIWLSDMIFCALPFLLLSLGSYHAACLSAIPLCFFVCAESKLKNTAKKVKFTAIFAFLWLCVSAVVLRSTTSVPQFVTLFGSAVIFLSFVLSSRKKEAEPLISKIIFAVSTLFSAVLWFFSV